MFIYILYICYIYKCVFMCVYMYIYECMYVYVYIYTFFFRLLFRHLESHSLSCPPLSLDTFDTRRNVWCSQPSTYIIAHLYPTTKDHMKTK